MTPSAVRGETLIEILGVERFLADRVFIPEDRRGLYLNEAQALRFANGRIIKDRDFSEESKLSSTQLVEISEKLKELEELFDKEFTFRANTPDQQSTLRGAFGHYPRQGNSTVTVLPSAQ